MKRFLEVCVDDAIGLEQAVAGGADRIELCSALSVGGLTPTPGLIALAAEQSVPVYAIIRPRSGDFIYSESEVRTMLADIDQVRAAGLAGVVLGASLADGRLDTELLARLIAHSKGLGLTLHRAFDLVPDFSEAIEAAVRLGFERILTSGGAPNVTDGLENLRNIINMAAGRISIMPGGGVSADNIDTLLEQLDVIDIHSSGGRPIGEIAERILSLGFDTPARRVTDKANVATMKAALSAKA